MIAPPLRTVPLPILAHTFDNVGTLRNHRPRLFANSLQRPLIRIILPSPRPVDPWLEAVCYETGRRIALQVGLIEQHAAVPPHEQPVGVRSDDPVDRPQHRDAVLLLDLRGGE